MKTAPAHLRALSKELAQCSMMHRLSDTDKELRSVLKEEAFRAIGDNAKRNGGWGNTRHGGEYRRPVHSILDPNTKQGKKTLKRATELIQKIGERTGRLLTSAGVTKRASRRTASAPKRQPRRHAGSQAKARAARKAPPARRCAVAGDGRPGPRAGGRSRRAIGVQQATSAASDDADHESDPDFTPGADGPAGSEMAAPRRSKRTAGGGGGLEDEREGAGGAPSAADDDEIEGAGDGGDHGGGGSAEGNGDGDIRAGSGNVGDGNAAEHDSRRTAGAPKQSRNSQAKVQAVKKRVGGVGGDCDRDSRDNGLEHERKGAGGKPLAPRRSARGSADGALDKPLKPMAAADGGAGGAAGADADKDDDDDSDGALDKPLKPRAAADSGAGGAACVDADKDDDVPLFSNRLDDIRSRLGQHQPPAPDSDDDDTKPPPGLKRLNKEQQQLELNTNIWSSEFAAQCGHLAWYQDNCGAQKMGRQVWLMKQENTAVFSAADVPLQVTITRRASPYLKKLLELKKFKLHTPDVKISFTVRRDSGRNWYLMYDDFAGVVIVSVEAIFKPVEDKTGNVNEDERWKGTMEYRRIFDTRDSALKSKDKKDDGNYMGAAYFRKLCAEEEKASLSQGKKIETFHPGNCVYKGDIRTLVGIVRWIKDKDVEVSNDYFTEYLDADLFRLGAYVNQNLRQ